MSNMQFFSVSDITGYVKQVLNRDEQLRDLWISGEVSNFVRSTAGHCYFTLKDNDAQLRCVLFKGNHGSEHLSNGTAVNVHGRIDFYEAQGSIQFYVDTVQPSGIGVLAAELERLKIELEKEGLFEQSRKRILPDFPNRIGVVTSETGSVLHDIQIVMGRRYPLAELILCPSSVQGEKSVAEIVDAIQTLNSAGSVDVIIVARGGGSLEDLWSFNTEAVARAIHASRVPVVSAIGHETDYTIADLVADVRAPTPSAAAEIVCPDRRILKNLLLDQIGQSGQILSIMLRDARQSVLLHAERMTYRLPDTGALRQRVDDVLNSGYQKLENFIIQYRERTKNLESQLTILSPDDVLRRGYAILQFSTSGQAITSTTGVQRGDLIQASLKDGVLKAAVESISKENE